MLLTITKSYKKVSFKKNVFNKNRDKSKSHDFLLRCFSVVKKLRFEKTEKQILFKE